MIYITYMFGFIKKQTQYFVSMLQSIVSDNIILTQKNKKPDIIELLWWCG